MLSLKKRRENIRLAFAVLQHYVRPGGSLNLTGINIHAEDFVRDILNALHSWNLTNPNWKTGNYPCIDLIEPNERIGVQVSSEKGSPKINRTITCLQKNSKVAERIDTLKIFELLPKQSSYAINHSCPGVAFAPRADIIDFDSVLKEVNAVNQSRLDDVHQVVTRAMPAVFASQRDNFQKQRSQLEKNLTVFDREVMRAPVNYEDPVEMYSAIREMRIDLQRNSSSLIANEVAAESFKKARDVLRRVEYDVKDQFVSVHLAAMNDDASPQYTGSDFSDAIQLMMSIRSELEPLINEIKRELHRVDKKLSHL